MQRSVYVGILFPGYELKGEHKTQNKQDFISCDVHWRFSFIHIATFKTSSYLKDIQTPKTIFDTFFVSLNIPQPRYKGNCRKCKNCFVDKISFRHIGNYIQRLCAISNLSST